ncbi:hypothetical protein SAMN02745245_01920 [Anaerosphaera aminiphila DSM 21120]|uniref:Uncharacterized protein n=1 Tax=Anaerosphaera aminiphila DSM 21120 TaxID=1120995 RepID=A0A1M5UYL7_9FIRM|nr:DUF5067 domain-containing protein [Anaerosphaera aminiphila]SHH67984.1 hypothetical protein SAMN02745245_01920 [Anaerosphaera aminiphila DSM 21120]
MQLKFSWKNNSKETRSFVGAFSLKANQEDKKLYSFATGVETNNNGLEIEPNSTVNDVYAWFRLRGRENITLQIYKTEQHTSVGDPITYSVPVILENK